MPGERSTSGEKVTLKTALDHFNVYQLKKQREEIKKVWAEKGGKSAMSCPGSQVKRVSRKKERSAV